ncbi:MAG: class I SAM-dependent methyltransferase [Alphaproteobacteria bacterium]|nr:class I SAM-dependent methyltransferase [Alphaproteobacteria bacterium]
MKSRQTEDKWEHLYRHDLGTPRYPNGNVVRWLFGNFPRSRAADFQLLDLGCGTGRHAIMMAQEGYQVSATDYAQTALDQAATWAGNSGVKVNFIPAPAEKQPFPDQSFDGILSYAVLYYLSLEKMQLAFREIHRLLKTGGSAFVMIKNQRDVRASKGREIAPHQILIDQTDDAMPWNNEQGMQLTLLPRAKLSEICQGFSGVMIDEMTTTLENGSYLEAAWLVHLTR